eukprot:g2012.t1
MMGFEFTSASRDWASRVLACTRTRAALKAELQDPFEELCEQPLAAFRREHGSAHEYMCANGYVDRGLANVTRSRYSNILPFDRGVVSVSRGGYINASWIRFPNLAKVVSPWIVTQGPMHPRFYGEDTTGSFWEMIFEHRAKAIVNLARCENGFGGCARYWPIHDDEFSPRDGLYTSTVPVTSVYGGEGGIAVTVKSCLEVEPGLFKREVHLCRNSSQAGNAVTEDGHSLDHFHFEKWPNYDIATDISTTSALLREIVSRSTKGDSSQPIVVHCSGGVGRSGTFVAAATTLLMCGGFSLDQAVTRGESGGSRGSGSGEHAWSSSHFANLVAAMRRQRHPWMVEGFAQFHFGARLAANEILLRSGADHSN